MNYFYNDNSFLGYYVGDYNTVLQTPVPSTGAATLFANLEENIIYSKKIVNGVPCIQSYKLTPIIKESTDNEELLKRIKTLENIIKGGNNGHDATITESTQEQKPGSI